MDEINYRRIIVLLVSCLLTSIVILVIALDVKNDFKSQLEECQLEECQEDVKVEFGAGTLWIYKDGVWNGYNQAGDKWYKNGVEIEQEKGFEISFWISSRNITITNQTELNNEQKKIK